VRKRRFPIVGDGGGIWSFVHFDDAASATVLALEREAAGIDNIVDDEPALVREWLPALAEVIGAKPPRRVRWLARLLAGEAGVVLISEIRASRTRSQGASSAGPCATRPGVAASSRPKGAQMRSRCKFDQSGRVTKFLHPCVLAEIWLYSGYEDGGLDPRQAV